jgi:hypothetical protein
LTSGEHIPILLHGLFKGLPLFDIVDRYEITASAEMGVAKSLMLSAQAASSRDATQEVPSVCRPRSFMGLDFEKIASAGNIQPRQPVGRNAYG